MSSVSIESLIEKFGLTNLTPQVDISNIKIQQPDINKPSLQLAGYFEHFEESRVQIIGFVEHSYIGYMTQEQKETVFPRLLTDKTPCIIFCRSLKPDDVFLDMAIKNNVPLLLTDKPHQRLWLR